MDGIRSAVVALRRTARTLASAPWRRAPLQGWRTPSLAIGVAVAAFVLGLAGASRPLFSASAGKASLTQDLTEGCAFEVGLRAERVLPVLPASEGDLVGERRAAVDEAVAPIPGVAPTVVTTLAGNAVASAADAGEGAPDATIQLVARDGFRDHIEVLADGGGDGLWVTDTVADQLGVGPGDTLAVGALGQPEPLTVPVSGVYRDLRAERGPFWCSMSSLFDAPSAGGSPPPPLALADGIDLVELARGIDAPRLEAWFEAPPDVDRWDLATAERTVPRLRGVADRMNDRVSDLALVVGGGPTSVDRPASTTKARSTLTAVESVAGPVAWGTIGVALTMLLTAARSWLGRRAQQVTVLTLRGAGPVAVGSSAVGEMLPALLVGLAAGVGGAVAVVRSVGPDPGIEGGAMAEGLVVVGLAALAAVVAIVVVVATGARRVGAGSGGAAPRRVLLPWEPVVLAGAAAALYEAQARPRTSDGRIDGLLLVFPLLLLAGGAGSVARLALSRRVLSTVADRAPTAGWLAARRLAANRARVALIITGAATSIGIVVFAGATSASVRATADAKALLGDGARQVVRLSASTEPGTEPPLAGVSTVVTRTAENDVVRRGHDRADVLGVDPATFADAAFWDRSFADRSLPDLLDEVGPGGSDGDDAGAAAGPPGEVLAIGVGTGLPDRFALSLRSVDGDIEVPVRIVARARWFPGYGPQQPRPLVVVDRAALTARGVVEHAEVWLSDDDPELPARLADDGLEVVYSRRSATTLTGTRLQPQVWAIDYLRVVGVAAGLVTVAGLGLHFAADAERRRLGAALARRLGLRGRQVTGATVVEVATILLGGVVLGVGLSWLAVRLVYRRLDPVPNTDPDPLLRYAPGLALVCLAVAVVVALVVTAVVERRSARSSLPELLRAAR